MSDEDKLNLYVRIVTRMKAVCEERGIAFRVLFVYPEKSLDAPHPQSVAAMKALGARGIDVYDLHSELAERQAQGGPPIYYEHEIFTGMRPDTNLLLMRRQARYRSGWKRNSSCPQARYGGELARCLSHAEHVRWPMPVATGFGRPAARLPMPMLMALPREKPKSLGQGNQNATVISNG